MATSKKNTVTSKAQPIRSSAQIKEDISKGIFTKAMHPWIVRDELSKDFGIDAQVEITRPFFNQDQIVSGKRICVQLKSTEKKDNSSNNHTLSIECKKISYWNNSIEPVLLVYVNVLSEICYFRWIDEELIQELNNNNTQWIAQETVSIKIPKSNVIDSSSLLTIEKYVLNWKIAAKSIMTPGTYFEFDSLIKKLFSDFVHALNVAKISFLSSEVEDLLQSLNQSIFTIAVVGPTKAGKSTLINSMLRMDISPVGALPTTGIPITIYPGAERKVTIVFKNDSEKHYTNEKKVLDEYTTQENNPNNSKNVKLVSVRLVNATLERGFAFCDVPGLDDADTEIRSITQTALFNVNAIIYMISAAPFASGDFSITKSIIEDLNTLGSRMERIFLVFNKIDVLSENDLSMLKTYINATLTKYEVLKYLPHPPIYISSKKSFHARTDDGLTNSDSVSTLEDIVWKHLISQNKTGLHRLIEVCNRGLFLSEKLSSIVHARKNDANTRAQLEFEIKNVQTDLKKFIQTVEKDKDRIFHAAEQYLQSTFANLLNSLKSELQGIASSNQLPNKNQVVKWLETNAQKAISDIYVYEQQELSKIQQKINEWVKRRLKQVGIIENHNDSIQTKATYYPLNTFFESNFTQSGFLENVLWGIGHWLVSAANQIINAFIPFQVVREKQIEITYNCSVQGYNSILNSFLPHFKNRLSSAIDDIKNKSLERARIYLSELSSQLQKCEQPLHPEEQANFEKLSSIIQCLQFEIGSSLNHLKAYTYGID